jgi:hypothetical protein
MLQVAYSEALPAIAFQLRPQVVATKYFGPWPTEEAKKNRLSIEGKQAAALCLRSFTSVTTVVNVNKCA